MGSPSTKAESTKLDAVDLVALSLDGPTERGDRNIFAFGTSATWGSTGETTTSNWGTLGSPIGLSSGADGSEPSVGPASFLSLSSTNTWGAPGLAGLGGDQAAD